MMENTLNFEEDYAKIKNLILSSDVANIRLGLELLTPLESHPKWISLLSTVYLHSKGTEGYEELSLEIETLLQKFLPSVHFQSLKATIEQYIEENLEEGYFGYIYSNLLKSLEDADFIDFNELANIFLQFNRLLLSYCLKKQTAPTIELLRAAICKNDFGLALYLNDGGFEEIPKEIGQLTELIFLQITGNIVHDLPNELANLKNLTHFHFDIQNFSAEALIKVEKWFPKIVADTYYLQKVMPFFDTHLELITGISKKKYLNIHHWLDKCIKLDPENEKYHRVKDILNRSLYGKKSA